MKVEVWWWSSPHLIFVKPSGSSSTQQNSEMISCSTALLDCASNLGPTDELFWSLPPFLSWLHSRRDHLVFSLRLTIFTTFYQSEVLLDHELQPAPDHCTDQLTLNLLNYHRDQSNISLSTNHFALFGRFPQINCFKISK